MPRFSPLALLIAAGLGAATAATAQERPNSFSLGIGLGVAPEFSGSSDYDFNALPIINFSYDLGAVTVRSKGLGVAVDVLDGPALAAGPIVRYAFGRDGSDITDDAVSQLPDIDGTLEVGGFAELRLPLRNLTGTRFAADLEIVQGVTGGHDGLVIDGSLGLERRAGPLLLTGGLTAGWADDGFTDTFFGVDTAGSAASGLAVYDPDGGITDLGVELGAIYPFTDRILGTAIIGYSELQGDAADSPIVDDTSQFFAIAGVAYRF
ncbi:MAG: MipA/OmpV family protein [Paracoccaceae bacterium]|nr:MipA/OmpV family protein [Paracoccaceae bacterium]